MLRTVTLLTALFCLVGCSRLGSHPLVTAAKEEVACLEDAIAALTEFVYVESHGEKEGE